MRIVSLNINGTKAFYNRGGQEAEVMDHLLWETGADIILFNETKCSPDDFNYWMDEWLGAYDSWATSNQYKRGYAGVAAMIKKGVATRVIDVSYPIMIDSEYDSGRIITIKFPTFYLVGVYVLNSSDKDELRQEWDKEFHNYISSLKADLPVIIMGDMNVCSNEHDCWAFEEYFDSMPGVKSYEIDAFHKLLSQGFVDSFRELHPEDIERYSWFSYRGNSRWTNKGFRLDYALVDDRVKDKIQVSDIIGGACEYSDHSPIYLEINL